MRVRSGTSGYAYKAWKGSFYPDDLPNDQMLQFYGTQFSTVEINNTFYRMPSQRVLLQWADQVPADFAFVLKASRRITHQLRLKNTEQPLRYLLDNAASLGARLGPMLFQLPPNLKKDMTRLQEFLDLLPKHGKFAFEFRHESWFDDDVYGTLGAADAALCVADTEDGATPFVATAAFGYLRLRRERYAKRELERWAKQVLGQQWSEVFVFFKHEDEGAGPKLARRFLEQAGA
jgi:uncharacterized protein YecE (DUF72 family)